MSDHFHAIVPFVHKQNIKASKRKKRIQRAFLKKFKEFKLRDQVNYANFSNNEKRSLIIHSYLNEIDMQNNVPSLPNQLQIFMLFI